MRIKIPAVFWAAQLSPIQVAQAYTQKTQPLNRAHWRLYGSFVAAVLAPVLWAGNFVVGRAVHQAFPPLTLNCFRWLIALIILVPLFARSTWRLRSELTHRWKSIALLALTGVVGFNSMLYLGLQHTTALSAAMIFSVTPLLIIGISVCLAGTRISALQMLAGMVSITGALMVLGGNIGSFTSQWMIGGNCIVLASCFVWATYCVLIKSCRINADLGSILLASSLVGLVIQIPLCISELVVLGLPHIDAAAVVGVAYLGLGAAALGFWVWQHAVSQLGPARCGVFLNLIPVFGVFMSIGLLHEQVRLHHTVGGLCVAIGVALAQIKASPIPATQSGARSGSAAVSSINSND
jgi:drug/metabolite transporter (DMT)-like permease